MGADRNLTLNYGLRYDAFAAFDAENQLSPRVNGVWKPTDTTTIHAGYARYFSPPPFELVASTSSRAVRQHHGGARPAAERHAQGRTRRLLRSGRGAETVRATGRVGLDSFYKASKNLIDEGQFGAPIILTPFNYAQGRQYGGEVDVQLHPRAISPPMPTPSYERAVGKNIISSQFQFDPGDLAYIANHYHSAGPPAAVLAVGGRVLQLGQDPLSRADLLYGTGLRKDGATPNGDPVPAYVTVNFGVSQDFDSGGCEGPDGAVRHPQCLR